MIPQWASQNGVGYRPRAWAANAARALAAGESDKERASPAGREPADTTGEAVAVQAAIGTARTKSEGAQSPDQAKVSGREPADSTGEVIAVQSGLLRTRAKSQEGKSPEEAKIAGRQPADATGEMIAVQSGLLRARTKSQEGKSPDEAKIAGRKPADSSGEMIAVQSGVVRSRTKAESGESPEKAAVADRRPAEATGETIAVQSALGRARTKSAEGKSPDEARVARREPPESTGEMIATTQSHLRRAAVLEASSAAPESAHVALDEARTHEDPAKFPALPSFGGGEDVFEAAIPDGMKLAHVDIATLEASPLARAELQSVPKRGSTGKVRIVVRWSHAPYGKIRYRIGVIASAGGLSPSVPVEHGTPGFEDRMKLLLAQDVPVDLVFRGETAERLNGAIEKLKRERGAGEEARTQEFITAGVVITLIIAAAVVIGLIAVVGLFQMAMEKGYDIRNSKFKAAAGEGPSRIEQELELNLSPPPSGLAPPAAPR